MRITIGLLRECIRSTITEAPLKVRRPETPEQKAAALALVRWVGKQMPGSEATVQKAIAGAENDDWKSAMSVLSMYYLLAGIPFKNSDWN